MQQVLVIGGGVIGLTSAWWLLEAGYRVTLLEKSPMMAAGASHSNGGQLSYKYVSPFADAGVPLKALQWLMQKDGPLRFRLEADPRQWRWLWQFLMHCRADVNRKTTERLLLLGELSRQEMARIEPIVPKEDFAWREAGKLIVYRSAGAFSKAAARAGTGEVLTAAQCVEREPALAAAQGILAGGIFNAGEAVADCHAFCQVLAARVKAHPRCDGVVQAQAQSLTVEGGVITSVMSDAGVLGADRFVLAAGIQSRELAATAGVYLPLYPIKGYSLTAPIVPGGLEVSVTDFERKVLYARIGDRLRVAAMADIVGADTGLDQQRIDGLIRQVKAMMPAAADYGNITAWAGLRPATPDSAPMIGATKIQNLFLNVGHGALGFTFACGSARVLSGLMRGVSTETLL
ncbi:D-amino acid dehydrogenase [Massilia sp. PAMC28688]|uniref:D-amino acid dehydrogenase n=1 Tax=Massilia sp. PAMC28688 TaxID=2861283 RepID=UPI001C632381|nr:D-amino acid dehydrogenase [Massilia sp. PAMC28688]QYF95286.1 D-amino acid dehydrogenase [Massilia sp. PAMC28688]